MPLGTCCVKSCLVTQLIYVLVSSRKYCKFAINFFFNAIWHFKAWKLKYITIDIDKNLKWNHDVNMLTKRECENVFMYNIISENSSILAICFKIKLKTFILTASQYLPKTVHVFLCFPLTTSIFFTCKVLENVCFGTSTICTRS